MLKKILQISSFAVALATLGALSATAETAGFSEEDLSAPVGSYNSVVSAPENVNTAGVERHMRMERIAMRMRNDEHRAPHNPENQK